MKKNKISKNWVNKQRRDTYVRQSKVDGYRARSAYKLIEINEKFRIFKGGMCVIDIGAAPGSWSQYTSKVVKSGKIIKLFRNLKEFDEDCVVTEFTGLFKLSPKGSKIITEKYTFLEQNHLGKFHDAISLKKAKIIDLLQELYENGVNMDAISLKGKWCEIDTQQDLEIAKQMFK